MKKILIVCAIILSFDTVLPMHLPFTIFRSTQIISTGYLIAKGINDADSAYLGLRWRKYELEKKVTPEEVNPIVKSWAQKELNHILDKDIPIVIRSRWQTDGLSI